MGIAGHGTAAAPAGGGGPADGAPVWPAGKAAGTSADRAASADAAGPARAARTAAAAVVRRLPAAGGPACTGEACAPASFGFNHFYQHRPQADLISPCASMDSSLDAKHLMAWFRRLRLG